jgi:NAD(P)-dependent dehydrogenase (short-subunit alcohol dehydrogenase family)
VRLAGKRCLIVGGAGGLGCAAARRFLEEGAHLVIADRDAQKQAEFLRELSGRGSVQFVAADAAVEEQVERLFGDAVRFLGGLDVLYHVAGGSGRRFGDGPLDECSLEGWRATLDGNLTSAFLTNRAAVRIFRTQGSGGAVLNMASVLALAPSPRHFDTCAYAAAKGGVIAMSRLAAARYAVEGIRVNVLAPGLIDTPMAARACGDPAILAYLRTKQPLAGGPGNPADCSDAAVFLCSDAARLITGVVLSVDAGWCISEGA